MLVGRSLFVLEWLLSQKQVQGEAVQEPQCVDGTVGEVWEDIDGYEGMYKISSLGRVLSVARFRRTKKNGKTWMPEKIMKLCIKKDTGRNKPYAEIRLRSGGARTERPKCFLVHRLVANAFIKKLEPKEQVDHINGVHSDNRVENLRVMTYIEHAKIHPLMLSPLERSPITGQFLPRPRGQQPVPRHH
jgi:hypothetical protein